MLELLAGAIIVGKMEVAPNTYQYDVLTKNGQIVRMIDSETENIMEIQ